MLLLLLKSVALLVVLLFLLAYTAKRIGIRFSPGAIPILTLLLALLIAVPYAGCVLAALFLLRCTVLMSRAELWPDSVIFTAVIVPCLWLMKFILF